MLNCREVTEHANDYVDGNLTSWQTLKVGLHILMCKYCRRFVGQIRKIGQLVRGYGRGPIDGAAEDRLIAAFRENKRRPVAGGGEQQPA